MVHSVHSSHFNKISCGLGLFWLLKKKEKKKKSDEYWWHQHKPSFCSKNHLCCCFLFVCLFLLRFCLSPNFAQKCRFGCIFSSWLFGDFFVFCIVIISCVIYLCKCIRVWVLMSKHTVSVYCHITTSDWQKPKCLHFNIVKAKEIYIKIVYIEIFEGTGMKNKGNNQPGGIFFSFNVTEISVKVC